MTFTDSLVTFEDVSVTLAERTIHHSLSLSIGAKSIVVLLGPSGTGKTVLLKMIIGLITPTQGRVLIEGRDIAQLNDEALREVRMNIGMLFQGAALFDSLPVFENIAYPLRERGGFTEEQIRSRVGETLAIVGLPEIADQFPPSLSGGQKKRVGLARSLATRPRILLFDEPTTGLDPTSRSLIDTLIVQLKEEYSITSIVVTHDMESMRHIADRIILLADGAVVADGDATTLLDSHPRVQAFVDGRWV